MKEKSQSPYKDRLPTAAMVKAIISQDRAVRFEWQQHPEEMPENIKRVVRVARDLNRRVIAKIKVALNEKK